MNSADDDNCDPDRRFESYCPECGPKEREIVLLECMRASLEARNKELTDTLEEGAKAVELARELLKSHNRLCRETQRYREALECVASHYCVHCREIARAALRPPADADAEMERLLALTDAELDAEVRAAGGDPEAMAERTRELLLAAVAKAKGERG